MQPLGPFEAAPRIAVAVSGGADSMALMLLAHRWASARGGEAVGLTVDHGLRPEAAAEARRVAGWLKHRGISHRVLRWGEAKPITNLQAAARAARYRLLGEWCRRASVLHLLLAHQLEDQAETFLLRLGRGSGVEGLAAMAPVTETSDLRLLRPLLTVPRARLAATLVAAKQDWLDDPSNRDPRHGRVRLRLLMPGLAREGLGPLRLAATARQLGFARQALEEATARLLADAVTIDPAGFAILRVASLAAAPLELGLRSLARVLQCVGGTDYPPRLERLERLYFEIAGAGLGSARTLSGCRILRWGPSDQGELLICREVGLIGDEMAVRPGAAVTWDRRFALTFAYRLPRARGEVRLGPLGGSGWAELVRHAPGLRAITLPAAVRPSLPALRDLEGLLAVPHLNYGRGSEEAGTLYVRRLAFRPRRPLAAGASTVA
ncbi:MAG TPA: tRNA lysidine(34) synthetase TilS [Alphaproteobacteria bacterium]|nr:tRNA lysidine(34) synthetase TilS [Alphaproteobacteria bacterium]